MYYSLASLPSDPRWYSLTLRGEFDHSKAVLLDNQLYQGRPGYHVLYPFEVDEGWVLVNLGWIAAPAYREQIPVLPEHHGEVLVSGYHCAPLGVARVGTRGDGAGVPAQGTEYQHADLAEHMELTLPSWVLQIDPDSPLALNQTWIPVVMGPQKHYAYALQWFLMALAVSGLAFWWLRRSKP